MTLSIRTVAHTAMSDRDRAGLRTLFDAEYLAGFGQWDPEQPYGYAPHDVHLIAVRGDEVVGHVGWGRRSIGVGERDVVVAGVGGVLVAEATRGLRLGERLMRAAVCAMKDGGVEFGFLGCREAVVPFYQSCGWTRVMAAVESLDRAGRPTAEPPGRPLLVVPVDSSAAWPDGEIDLRGRAW